jgi:hypothetical protein
VPASDIASAGSAQITVFNPAPAGGTSNALTFTINSAGNPVPALTSISPSSVTAGGAAFTLTVNGSNFVSASSVQWNGSNLATTYMNAAKLTATVPASDIASAGSAQITVFNPAPAGGTSNALSLLIAVASSSGPATPTLNLPSDLPMTATITAGYNDPDDPAVAFNWTFTLQGQSQSKSAFGTPAQVAAFSSAAPSLTMQTLSPEAILSAVPSLVPGLYLITVSAVDNNHQVSPAAQANVTLVAADLASVRLYPNPWKANKHEGLPIKFDNLTVNSTVKIFALSGREVRTLPKSSSTVTWDLTNDSGDKVASGIYLYLIKTDDGQKKTGKLAIVK